MKIIDKNKTIFKFKEGDLLRKKSYLFDKTNNLKQIIYVEKYSKFCILAKSNNFVKLNTFYEIYISDYSRSCYYSKFWILEKEFKKYIKENYIYNKRGHWIIKNENNS